jgi:DNA-binding IclR family transcriptional regulator
MMDNTPPVAEEAGTAGVAALERGLSILEAFKQGKAVLTLADLAAETGLYKSTILRLVASLLRFGYLQRLEDGRYRLGPAVFPFGRLYQSAFNLRDALLPGLRNLAATTGESASFYVRDGDSEVCLYRAASPNPVRDAGIGEGARFPIDSSVCSLVLSAFSGQPGEPFERARRTVVSTARPSNRVPGVSAIVCPVFTVDQKLAGALLLSGPEARFTDQSVQDMTGAIVEEAAALTRALGGDPAVFAAVAAGARAR